ncbi:MAG: hypothetical protein JO336_07420, partial [Acidobacteriia bacterium]|nr:hypothetical protein [Terriglobia bacterium]
ATTVSMAVEAGATAIPVAGAIGFRNGQTITIGSGTDSETAVIASVPRFGAASITLSTPVTRAHAAGVQVSGTGITLTSALARAHAIGAQIADNVPTPGGPNRYYSNAVLDKH